jgi:hypothetical protein
MHYQPQTFFRPDEIKRERSAIRADVFNRCRLLLQRSPRDCAFVPIRAMQFLGVVTNDEVIFVDSEAYAVRDGEGGRLILLAWQTAGAPRRDSLTAPVSIDVVHYQPGQEDTQRRLVGELAKAADLLLARQQTGQPAAGIKVVPMGRAARSA